MTSTFGTLVDVDPRTVTIAANVREDLKLAPEFVASIKASGILQPPTIVQNDAGAYEVIMGQRRTLGAVEAGMELMPAFLVDAQEAARILSDQITENEQRQELSNSELMGGYKRLALFGLSVDDIVEKTKAPRKVIENALTAAGSEHVEKVVQEKQIDLEQAAAIVEFEGNAAAVKELTRIAVDFPRNFESSVREYRRKRDLAASKKDLAQKMKAERIAKAKSSDFGYTWQNPDPRPGRKLELLRNDKGKGITPSAHAKCPGHGAYIEAGMYDSQAKLVYVCTDWKANGHHLATKEAAPRTYTPEEIAEQEKQEAERAAEELERQRLEAERDIARELRTEFIVTLLQRNKITTLPGSAQLLAIATVAFSGNEYWNAYTEKTRLTLAFLGLPIADQSIDDDHHTLNNHTYSAAKGHDAIALAGALAMFEHRARRKDDDDLVLYFETLAKWGHNLTVIEQRAVDQVKAAIADREAKAAEAAAAEGVDQ